MKLCIKLNYYEKNVINLPNYFKIRELFWLELIIEKIFTGEIGETRNDLLWPVVPGSNPGPGRFFFRFSKNSLTSTIEKIQHWKFKRSKSWNRNFCQHIFQKYNFKSISFYLTWSYRHRISYLPIKLRKISEVNKRVPINFFIFFK